MIIHNVCTIFGHAIIANFLYSLYIFHYVIIIHVRILNELNSQLLGDTCGLRVFVLSYFRETKYNYANKMALAKILVKLSLVQLNETHYSLS